MTFNDEISDKITDIQAILDRNGRRHGLFVDLAERVKIARRSEDEDLAKMLLEMLKILRANM